MRSKWTLGRLAGGGEWIHQALDRDHWRAVVNAMMNLFVLVPWSSLLYNIEIPRKLINLIKESLTTTKSKVVIQGISSEEFETQKDFKQGDAVSTILFNLVLEMEVRATTTIPGGTIFKRLTQCIAYADDDVITGKNVNGLKQTFIEFTKEARKLGLVANIKKTKYIIAS
jgi:hypothetical protein